MIDNRLALMTQGPDLAGAGQNALSAFMGVQQNKRRNKLLELNQQQAEFDQNMENQRLDLSKKAFDLQEQQHRAATQKQAQAKQQEQLQIFAQMAQGLAKLPQGERAAAKQKYKEMYLPIYGEEGVARFDNLPEDDSTLQQVLSGLSPYLPKANVQDQLRARELDIKEDRLEFDKDQAQLKLDQLSNSVDALDIPEEDKKALKALPPDTLDKVIGKHLDPKNKKTQEEADKELKQARMGAAEVRDLANDLLRHPGREAATGSSSLFWTRPGGDAKDFEVKLERLSSLLTVDNLDKMSGVLSESDVAILKAAAAGLDLGQSEEAFAAELERIVNKMNEKLGSEPGTVGRFKVRSRNGRSR